MEILEMLAIFSPLQRSYVNSHNGSKHVFFVLQTYVKTMTLLKDPTKLLHSFNIPFSPTTLQYKAINLTASVT